MRHIFKIRLLGIGVMLASLTAPPILAASNSSEPLEFTLRPLAYLGDPAPGGGEFFFDFEPYAINNRGDVGFGADLLVGDVEIGEGVFLRTREAELLELVRAGDTTPEGTTIFGSFFFDKGDTDGK